MEQTSSFVLDPHVQCATLWKCLIRTFRCILDVVGAKTLVSFVTLTALDAASDIDNSESFAGNWFMIFSFSCEGD